MMSAEAENDCPICQETLHGSFSVGCTVPCGHLFHRRCFESWQVHSSSKKCPCCNSKLAGFIDKIHITLPASSSNLLEDPEIKLQRRKALSNEKAKRSAMMRHKDRRRTTTTQTKEFRLNEEEERQQEEARDEVEEDCRNDRSTTRGREVSLSASLQRVPQDPVKGAELGGMTFFEETYTRGLGVRSFHLGEDDFSGVEHLEEQIPDVAEKIMQNIQRSLRQARPESARATPRLKLDPSGITK